MRSQLIPPAPGQVFLLDPYQMKECCVGSQDQLQHYYRMHHSFVLCDGVGSHRHRGYFMLGLTVLCVFSLLLTRLSQ